MHPEDIRAALKKAGESPTTIAAEFEISEKSVRQVIKGVGRSKRVEQRISEITDIPLYRLWPSKYEAPEGAPKDFDPLKLNADLLEAVEHNLSAELQRRIPGLVMPFIVRGRHRAAVYNACVGSGTAAIETGAGTADQVHAFLEAWALDYELTTGQEPTPEAMRKWALTDSSQQDAAAGKKGARITNVTASHGSTAVGHVSGGARVRLTTGKL
jgi:lambda repressor-like predicted transcriptional regulator